MKTKSDAASARAPQEPSDASSDNVPVLGFVRPIAMFAVVAVLVGRAFGSSLRGLAVGLGKHAERLEFLGAMLSQCFLILATIVSLGLVLSALRAPTSWFVRFVCVSFGGLVTLSTLLSMATRVPATSLAATGGIACALALVAAWDTIRTPFARAASIVLGGVALGGVARVVAVTLLTSERMTYGRRVMAQSASTVGLVLDGLAMAVAVGFVASRSRKPSSPATIVALGAALVATRVAMGGAVEDASLVSVLFDRAVRALVVRPEPSVSYAVVTFFAFAAPALAIAVLATPTLTPALSGSIALLLLAHGAPDVPLCALMIAIASIATILASRDHRGVWAAIGRENDARKSAASSSE